MHSNTYQSRYNKVNKYLSKLLIQPEPKVPQLKVLTKLSLTVNHITQWSYKTNKFVDTYCLTTRDGTGRPRKSNWIVFRVPTLAPTDDKCWHW